MSAYPKPAPIIARMGGLSCDVIEAFSTRLGDQLELIRRKEQTVQQVRQEFVDCLYAAIHGAEPEKRHVLLAVKRDCFNNRPLHAHGSKSTWRFVEEAAGSLADRMLDVERELESEKRKFLSAFDEELRYQHNRLSSVLDEPMFRCGVTLASSLVAREADRLRRGDPENYGRREKRLVATVLRYMTRAALKLSPFSTFTTVGFCSVEDSDASLKLTGDSWRYHSLVRLRRHVLDRCMDMLARYGPWKEAMEIALNDSIVRLKEGALLFRRSGCYRHDEKENKLRYHRESLVRVEVEGPFFERLKEVLAAGPVPYRELVELLDSEFRSGTNNARTAERLDQFMELGLLCLAPPWNTDDCYLEKRMTGDLRPLLRDPLLAAWITKLERLVELEGGFLDAADHVSQFGKMQQLIHELLRDAATIGQMPADMIFTQISRNDIYQDVWCAPQCGSIQSILHASKSALEEAQRSLEPFVRYSRLFDHRVDFLYTLGAFLHTRGAGCRIAVMEAFDCVQPLWQEFMKFQMQIRHTDRWQETWNPLGVELLQELASYRQKAGQGLGACLADAPDGRHVVLDDLNALLAGIPPRFTEGHSGSCLFLQPASADGSLWVLNRLKEGTGRFASRYTPLMSPEQRQHYTQELMRRGTFDVDGEKVQLLDVQCAQGDTLNVHAPETPKVLTLPGARTSMPQADTLTLKDLFITLDPQGLPQIRDAREQRYFPVHLGVGYHDYLPTLVKFLCAFGPTELEAVFPMPLVREIDGITVQERTVAGNVVLHRKTWRVPVAEVRRCLECPTDAEAFAALHHWRRQRGIPEQVFATERAPHPLKGFRYKPQYVDFSSPLFLPIFRAIVSAEDQTLRLVEMLPSPKAFPKDLQGRQWAIELLLDSLALREPADTASRDGFPVAVTELLSVTEQDGP